MRHFMIGLGLLLATSSLTLAADLPNTTSSNVTPTSGTSDTAAMEQISAVTRAEDFVPMAGMGGLFEIESGKLAAQKANSPAVKQFGQMMVDDHSKANQELMTVARSAGVTMQPPKALDQKHQAIFDDLSKANGTDFDRAFQQAQLKAHDEAIMLFTSYSKNGDKPELKSAAGKLLPTLQKHRDEVEKLLTQ